MPANWIGFINQYSKSLRDRRNSSGNFAFFDPRPQIQSAKDFAGAYLEALKTAQAVPSGNRFNSTIGNRFKPILTIGFTIAYIKLKSSPISWDQRKKDKRYFDSDKTQDDLKLPDVPTDLSQAPNASQRPNLIPTQEEIDFILASDQSPDLNFFDRSYGGSKKIFNYSFSFDYEAEDAADVLPLTLLLDQKASPPGSTPESLDYLETYQPQTQLKFLEGVAPLTYFILTSNSGYDPDKTNFIKKEIFDNPTFDLKAIEDRLLVTDFEEAPDRKKPQETILNLRNLRYQAFQKAFAVKNVQITQTDENFFFLYRDYLLDLTTKPNQLKILQEVLAEERINILSLYLSDLYKWVGEIQTAKAQIEINKTLAQSDQAGSESPITQESFGIETGSDSFYSLVGTNSPIPSSGSNLFTTLADFQTFAEVVLVKGDSKDVSKNVTFGSLRLEGIEIAKAGIPRILVTVDLLSSDRIRATAQDLTTGAIVSKEFGGEIEKIENENNVRLTTVEDLINSSSDPDLDLTQLSNLKGGKNLIKRLLDLIKGKKDPYEIMATTIILYWTAVGLVPNSFQNFPPVLPATTSVPGTFTILFPGLVQPLANSLRRAYNVGLNPIFSPTFSIEDFETPGVNLSEEKKESLKNALDSFSKLIEKIENKDTLITEKATATSVAVALALHLLLLKFLYLGSTPSPLGPVPTPGIVFLVV